MADDYTPSDFEPFSDAEMREIFLDRDLEEWAKLNPQHRNASGEDWDRWLAAHDAAKRAEWEAEHPDVAALREARAETWDEAVAAVFAWWSAPEGERPALIVNPYGAGVPVNENGETP